MNEKRLMITEVIFSEDYTVNVRFSNGHRIIYDIKPLLKTSRFCELTDLNLFKSGKLMNNRVIRWNEMMELSMEEMILTLTNIRERNVGEESGRVRL